MWLTSQMIPRWQPFSCQTLFNITLVIMGCYFPFTYLLTQQQNGWMDLPHDTDGLKLYKIKCSPWEWVQKSQDLRYFKMHSSRRKDLIGARKVGRFIGNLYCSYDDCLFKLSAEGKRNNSNFQNVDGCKICFSCGNVASRHWCGACKMTEYYREPEPHNIPCRCTQVSTLTRHK